MVAFTFRFRVRLIDALHFGSLCFHCSHSWRHSFHGCHLLYAQTLCTEQLSPTVPQLSSDQIFSVVSSEPLTKQDAAPLPFCTSEITESPQHSAAMGMWRLPVIHGIVFLWVPPWLSIRTVNQKKKAGFRTRSRILFGKVCSIATSQVSHLEPHR